MDLIQRRGNTDMRIESTAGSSDKVHRDGKSVIRVSRFKRIDTRLNHINQSRIERAIVRARGTGQRFSIEGIVWKVSGCRETAPEIFRVVKLLTNQFRAIGFAINHD